MSCSIKIRKTPKRKVVNETKFSLKISFQHMFAKQIKINISHLKQFSARNFIFVLFGKPWNKCKYVGLLLTNFKCVYSWKNNCESSNQVIWMKDVIETMICKCTEDKFCKANIRHQNVYVIFDIVINYRNGRSLQTSCQSKSFHFMMISGSAVFFEY